MDTETLLILALAGVVVYLVVSKTSASSAQPIQVNQVGQPCPPGLVLGPPTGRTLAESLIMASAGQLICRPPAPYNPTL